MIYWYRPVEQPAPNPTEANKILPVINRPSGYQKDSSDKAEIKKILFKNQRPPAELVLAPSKGHPYTPNSAAGR